MAIGEATTTAHRRIIARRGVASLILLICALAKASDNPTPAPPAATVHTEIVHKTPDADDPGYFQVSVRLDVQALDKRLVIPYCAGDKSDGYLPCSARLQRMHGKRWIYAKPVFGAVMGTEALETWKALTIAPGDHARFNFGFGQRFFAIQEGETLRIAIDTWASGNSWSNSIPDHVVWSTPFRFSVK
jgi:hypothetical protein